MLLGGRGGAGKNSMFTEYGVLRAQGHKAEGSEIIIQNSPVLPRPFLVSSYPFSCLYLE